MKIKFEENTQLTNISPIEVIQFKIPNSEEIQFNKISNQIEKHLIYAKAFDFIPSSMAKSIAYHKLENILFSNILSIYFPKENISARFIENLCLQMNAFFGQSTLAKLSKACSTANFISCRIFTPKNPVAHLYALIYLIVEHLNEHNNLADFDLDEHRHHFMELYSRGEFYAQEI
jgi:hypothetical protein